MVLRGKVVVGVKSRVENKRKTWIVPVFDKKKIQELCLKPYLQELERAFGGAF